MTKDSRIEWTDNTFNPWRGCTKVSDGCKFCYAETLSGRNPAVLGKWGPKGERVIAAEAYWKEPLRWNEAAKAKGVRERVFCASLADVFEGGDTMPAVAWMKVQAARLRLFLTIMATPHLDWLLLTKRPENIMPILASLKALSTEDDYFHAEDFTEDVATDFAEYVTAWEQGRPPNNVWMGTSVENQETADSRIPALLSVPAVIRFLSCEPLLGAVDLRHIQTDLVEIDALTGDHGVIRPLQGRSDKKIHWVIAGGESGPNARPSHPDWFRSLRDQCVAAGVAYFHKQWGENIMPSQMPDELAHALVKKHGEGILLTETYKNVGKKAAGRLLDGRTWDEFPQVKIGMEPLPQGALSQKDAA